MATCTNRTTADSSAAQLYMAEEDCWGADPNTISPRPVLTAVRFTGESLVHNTESVTSNEIRSDSQITDQVRVGVGASGDVNFELSYGTFDRFFEGALRNNWTDEIDLNVGSPVDADVTISVSPSTLSFAGSPNPLVDVQVGQFLQVTNSQSSPSNNGYYEVTENSAGTLTVTPAFSSDETNSLVRVHGSHLRNGTTKKSYLIEKRFTDLSPIEYLYFTGMRVGGVSATIEPGSILTGTLSFLGKRGFAQNVSAGLSDTEAPTGDVANAVDNISNILLDGTALDADLTSMSFEINNNTRDKPAIANLGNIDIGLGRFNVNGSIVMYFSSRTLYDKYLAFTAHSWSFVVSVGNDAYVFHFPSIKFSEGQILSEGNDGDVLADMSFQARRDPTLGYTMGIDRFSTASEGSELS